jgi:aminoglycoside phosphotransferase (APT) family kinase protein
MNAGNLAEQIKTLYERDQRSGAKAVAPGDVPVSYDAITPEWMTHFVCAGTPGAKVIDIRLGPPDDGSTNRRRLSLAYNAAGQAAGLPASVFCKASFSLINRMNMGLCGAAHGETMFYTKIRHLLDIDAPRPFHAVYDPQSFAHIVVLEDLGGKVEFGEHTTDINRDRAASMVSTMAAYHATMATHPGIRARSFGLPTFPEFWKTIEDRVFMEKSSNDGFLACENEIPERLYRRFREIYPATRRAVAMHETLPQTLLHSDVHLKNWYVRDGNRMGLPDWHCCCIGNWSRDFAYAISVALTPENRRRWEKELLRLYLSEVAGRGAAAPSFDEAWSLYKPQLFTALAFWTNTLCPTEMQPQNMQPQQTAREFIRRIACAIDDLDALG